MKTQKDPDALAVDLKVTSTADLEEAINTIRATIDSRELPDAAVVTAQLKHIEAEVALGSPNGKGLLLSLEHLELYRSYLRRLAPQANHRKIHTTLIEKVQKLLKTHPLAGVPRSGDVYGGEQGSAYLKVPAGRRRQTTVMLYLNLLTGPWLVFTSLFILWYIIPYSTVIVALYIAWVCYDNVTRPKFAPGRVSQKWRHTKLYELFRDYFPIRIVKADPMMKYSAKKNFLFCYHPHGVQSAGAFSFASAATGFDQLFPGLSVSIQTLGINFKIPLTRENLISLGAGDASKECLQSALTSSPGSSAMLVTGGAKESMETHPFTSKVVLKSRKGFVKVALRTGASLVPVWGFGENNLYDNIALGSPWLLRMQRRVQRVISFAPLLVAGRGVFTYSGGLLPRRRPITCVVGPPIDVGAADPNPSQARIEKVHAQYTQAVEDLFNQYKEIYDPKAEPIQFV